jgi:hypothetical protein
MEVQSPDRSGSVERAEASIKRIEEIIERIRKRREKRI